MPIAVGTGLGLAALASVAGSVYSSERGAHSAKQQMKFQERMSSTAHTREIADLKKAGINPLLTGKYGGSSTPAGTAFTPSNPAETLPQIASAAGQLKQSKPLVQAQTLQVNQNTAKTAAETAGILESNSRLENMFPLEMDKLIQETETSGTTSALQQKQKIKVLNEIKTLKLELEKLAVTRRLWGIGGELLPKANEIKKTIEGLKDLEKIGIVGTGKAIWNKLITELKKDYQQFKK